MENHFKTFENFQLNEKHWRMTIDLKNEYEQFQSIIDDDFEDVQFVTLRDQVYTKLKDLYAQIEAMFGEDNLEDYKSIVEDLSLVEDIDMLDDKMNSLYDWADRSNVWIKTI